MIKFSAVYFIDILLFLIGTPTLFMMIFTSRGFTEIKTVLLTLVCLISFFDFILIKRKFSRYIFLYTAIFVTYFLSSICYGVFSGFDFTLKRDSALIQYYIFTPFIIILISNLFKNRIYRAQIFLILIKYITLITAIMDVWKLMSFKKLLPNIDFFSLLLISNWEMSSSKLSLRISNEHAFMYLIPFYIIMLVYSNEVISDKIIYGTIVFFGVIYSLISGRKALQGVILFTLILIICRIFLNTKKAKIKINFLFIFMFVFVFSLWLGKSLEIGNVLNASLTTFNNGVRTMAKGVMKRSRDIDALFDMWLCSPFIGFGLQSYYKNTFLNLTGYWSYEVVYNALLAQTGIIGVGIFFWGTYKIVRNLIHKYKNSSEPLYFAAAIGFISFIICGGTNPLVYIPWPWIITLAINFYR